MKALLILFLSSSCNPDPAPQSKESSTEASEIQKIIKENHVVTRDHKRILEGDLLSKIQSAQKRRNRTNPEDETGDFVAIQAENQLLDFYLDMPEEVRIGFEQACEEGAVKVEYHYLTATELEQPGDRTSDYIQTKVAEGEMLKEIEEHLLQEELILTDLSQGETLDITPMELYNESGSRSGGIQLKKYFSYRKAKDTRSSLGNNEIKINAAVFAQLLALLNYQAEVSEIAKLFGKQVQIEKIQTYHEYMKKGIKNTLSRSKSSDHEYYSTYLISNDEIKKGVLKTGQFLCRSAKVKKKGSIYGIYDHAGLIDLRRHTKLSGEIIATNDSPIVLSAYPKSSKGSLLGDRMPEKLGYPSFEPLKNFTQGHRIALLEPFVSQNRMTEATAYAVATFNKCNLEYNLPLGPYCSFMPYVAYRHIGINLNSDVKNQSPAVLYAIPFLMETGISLFAGVPLADGINGILLAILTGQIITPDDIYHSSYDQYGYDWFQVWVPTGYWKWQGTGNGWWEWWKGYWKWESTGGFHMWRYGWTKIYKKQSRVVLQRAR